MPANVMVVNLIPRSLSGESSPDSEPNLAVNPANPQLMVASAFTPNPGGSGDAPIYVSTDGGNTWSLHAIVPSDQMTADITLRFGSSSNNLYAGIIRTPIVSNAPRLNILRTNNVLSGLPMDVLVDRTGQGVDQPYIQAATVPDGKGGSVDVVVCGDNDFNHQPQSATMDVSGNAGTARAPFKNSVVDVRPAAGGDAPSIRPAIHSDGTVYGAFLRTVSVAINSSGVVGFVYQQLTGPFKPNHVSAANRWVTHFQTSKDGGTTWNDLVLATTPANVPPNNPPNVTLPYLGDYLHLMAIGNDFYGVFSANNTPDPANFPNGVVFQRNHSTATKTLFDVDGVTHVDVSIDPFFFKV